MRHIIGLTGPIGSGKTSVANILCQDFGFVRVRFAGPLKNMMTTLGLTLAEIEGELKEKPCALLCGKTPRHAMQTIGTEWGRNLIGEDLWVNAWRHQVNKMIETQPVVCDDVRFANEAKAIRDMGGLVVRVTRPGKERISSHPSEAFAFDVDAELNNVTTLDGLRNVVRVFAVGLTQYSPDVRAELTREAA